MIYKKILLKIAFASTGKYYGNQYKKIKSINTNVDLVNFQNEYLKKIIIHSYYNVPYYKKIFDQINIIKNNQVDLSKFNKIPILTKDLIRKNQKELISKDYKTRKWYWNSSGGSTGEPLKLLQDETYRKWSNATQKYYYKDILNIDEENVKKIILWGSEKDLFEGNIGLKAKIINWLKNTIFLNSFKMTKKDMDRYIDIINSYKPKLIKGYASSLYELCKYAERKNKKIYTPKILVSAAETLRNETRQKIENVFNAKLYDFYGSREASSLGGECKCGLMHLFTFNQYIEILDNNNLPIGENKEGKVIVTTLHNYSMPLIRYKIGDMAILKTKKCKCGNVLPALEKITGRITDHFILENGTVVPAEFFIHLIGVVCNKVSIKKFQVIQEDYRKIRILVVLGGDMNEYEKKDVEGKIKVVMGQNCKIIWEFVKEIPKTPQGKYLYTKSLIYK